MSAIVERKDSFDSIPEVDFINELVRGDIEKLDKELISAFKLMEMNGELKPEPLLIEDKSRFVLFPIKQPDVSILISKI